MRAEIEAKQIVDKLYEALPRQQFVMKIQGRVMGKLIATKKKSAVGKDVTAHLYGGDITRKMKLRDKQKKGKAKALERGRVHIPQDVFMKMMKGD